MPKGRGFTALLVKLKDYFKGNSYTRTIVIDGAGDNRFIDLDSFLYVVQPITGNIGILRERYGDPHPQQRIIIQGNPRDTPGTILQGAWESGSSPFKKFQWNTMKNVCFKGGEVALEYLQSKSREEIAPPQDGDFTESYADALASEGLIHTETADDFKKMYPGIPGKLDDRLVMFPRIRCAPHDIRPTDFFAGADYGFQDYRGLVIVAADRNTGPGNVVYQVYGDGTGARTADSLANAARERSQKMTDGQRVNALIDRSIGMATTAAGLYGAGQNAGWWGGGKDAKAGNANAKKDKKAKAAVQEDPPIYRYGDNDQYIAPRGH
jgi:hypothetical protein